MSEENTNLDSSKNEALKNQVHDSSGSDSDKPEDLRSKASELVTDANNQFEGLAEDVKKVLCNVKDKANEFIEGDGKEMIDNAKVKASDIAKDAQEVLTNIKEEAKEFIDGDGKEMFDIAKEKVNAFSETASEKLDIIAEESKESLTEVKQKTKGFFQRLFGSK